MQRYFEIVISPLFVCAVTVASLLSDCVGCISPNIVTFPISVSQLIERSPAMTEMSPESASAFTLPSPIGTM